MASSLSRAMQKKKEEEYVGTLQESRGLSFQTTPPRDRLKSVITPKIQMDSLPVAKTNMRR